MSATTSHMPTAGILSKTVGRLFSLVIGSLLCLTAPTSLIVLGWLMRRMRYTAMRRSGLAGELPGWIIGNKTGRLRIISGLAANVREGVMAAFSLALATAPFTVIWILSWWAGWENSFSKGYEQAFVGPILGLAGVVVFCFLMIWLPLAIAHQAVEDRALALFEWRMVRSAVRHTGWGYLVFALASVVLALPIFASRGLVTFASGIVPGFDAMTPDEISSLANGIDLVTAGYVFVSLVFLRIWSARIYASAVARAIHGPDASLWQSSPLAKGHLGKKRSWSITHWVRLVFIAIIWFGLAAQIYIAQFLNHGWHMWITHPYFLLPWGG